MGNHTTGHPKRKNIPWNWIAQIVLVIGFFALLGWMVNSLSFAGRYGFNAQATQVISSLEIFDNFGFKVYDTKWNESTWAEVGAGTMIQQLEGVLNFSRDAQGSGGLVAHRRVWKLSQINYVESRLMLNGNLPSQGGEIGVVLATAADPNHWFVRCDIQGKQGENTASALCKLAGGFSTSPIAAAYDTWHTLRFEVDSEKTALAFFVDDQPAGSYALPDTSSLEDMEYVLILDETSSGAGSLSGSFDYVQLKNR